MLLQRLADWQWKRVYRRWRRLGERLYPDPLDRASMLMAEGAEVQEMVDFAAGRVVTGVSIAPGDDGGYHLEVAYADAEDE